MNLRIADRPRPLRILCVEDQPMERKLLVACLEMIGADCLVAGDGAEAVMVFRRAVVDLVLLDLRMPHVDGLAALAGIRATPGRGKRVPVLAVTTNDRDWDAGDYRAHGFCGLYVKPIEPSRLYVAIDRVLRESGQPPLFGTGARIASVRRA